MKTKIYLLILATSLMNLIYAQQFTPQFTGLGTVGSTSPFHMVAIDENTVWASASSPNAAVKEICPNLVVHTEDGGMTWEIDTLPTDTPDEFYVACISAMGEDSAWVSSIDKVDDYPNWEFKIYATFDRGMTWNIQDVPFSDNENYGGQIHFFTHLEGIIFAGNTDGYFQVFKTFDGGNSWNRLPEANFPPLLNDEYDSDDGYYAIRETIWVGTNKGRILKSTDKGETWTAKSTPISTNELIFEVTFSDSLHGIARYTNNFDYYTTNMIVTSDGGENWSLITPQGLGNNIYDLNSIPNKSGENLCTSYSGSAVVSNKLYYSSDNGASWIEIGQVNIPGRIALFNSEIGWISEIGSNTLNIDVYKMEGQITETEELTIEEINIYPNPVRDLINLKLPAPSSELVEVQMFNMHGKLLEKQHVSSRKSIAVEKLPAGIYLLKVKVGEKSYINKFIKQ